jgi:hypothetical protein
MVSGKICAVGSTNPRVRLLGRCPFFGGGLRKSPVVRANFGRRDMISGYDRPNHRLNKHLEISKLFGDWRKDRPSTQRDLP